MEDIPPSTTGFRESLLQLKTLYRQVLSVRKGLLAGFAFLSFSVAGVLPVVPEIERDAAASQGVSVVTSEKRAIDPRELCRLQADVRFFAALQEKSGETSQTEALPETPCEQAVSGAESSVKQPAHSDSALDATIQDLTEGYPLSAMAPAIAAYDRGVAGLLVGIAKKESNWGKRVPTDASGADCFNYWGYKGAGSRGVAMGHGCFGSKEEAVTVVGDRLQQLVVLRQTSEPENMIIWKCGSSCKGHSDASVKKWIADVSVYYHRIAVTQ